MDEYEKIINDLNTINSKAKFIGIKIIMVRRIIDMHKDNDKLIKKVLEGIKNTDLYDLVLNACPELKGERIKDVYFKKNDYFNVIKKTMSSENTVLKNVLINDESPP
ncbi:DNA-directed RNA polymerase subunit I [Methanocaldococcus jannaschii]|nr:DNA-directed RNA polymerase subunit I [Methanocaldococcus jannaschii]